MLGGYFLGVADFNGLNAGWLLASAAPTSWGCADPYPPPANGPHAGHHLVRGGYREESAPKRQTLKSANGTAPGA